MKYFMYFFIILFMKIAGLEGQKIEAYSNASGETAIIGINSHSSINSNGIYGEGKWIGLNGYSLNGKGVRGKGQSISSFGVYGESIYGIGVSGISFGNHGAIFTGPHHSVGSFADIVLGGNLTPTIDDNGIIRSDFNFVSSDIFLQANDAIVMEVGNTESEDGSFEIWNKDQSDKLLVIGESGYLLIKGNLLEEVWSSFKDMPKVVEPKSILKRALRIPIEEWSNSNSNTKLNFIGPSKNQYNSLFNPGSEISGISSLSVSSIALASVQALHELIEEQKTEIEQLKSEIQSLKELFYTSEQRDIK